MLSKSLKNIHSLKKDEYSEKNNILKKIYKKDSCLIKLNELKNDFYENSLFYKDFYIFYNQNIKLKVILDKLVYFYSKYNFFVFNDIESVLFVLSACGGIKEFRFFYEIFKEKYLNNKYFSDERTLKHIFLVSILYDNLDVFKFLNSEEKNFIESIFNKKIKTNSFLLASKHGSIKIVNYFLSQEQEIDINVKDEEYKRTALIWAVIEGHKEIVQLLLDKGAKIDEKDDYEKTPPFILAIKMGHIEIVKLLIDKGADINEKDNGDYKRTPLIWASIYGSKEIVELLLDKGAKIDEKDDIEKRTPLIWAVIKNHIEVVELLINKGANINEKDNGNEKRTPLIWAIINNNIEIVKLLIDKGANINEKDNSNEKRTPLIWASVYGYTKIVKLLVEKGAEVNEKDIYGKTAIDYAEKKVIKQILLRGLNKNKKKQKQTTK